MAWCCQATSLYPSQCWPRSMAPYGVTRPQYIKHHYVSFSQIKSLVIADGWSPSFRGHDCWWWVLSFFLGIVFYFILFFSSSMLDFIRRNNWLNILIWTEARQQLWQKTCWRYLYLWWMFMETYFHNVSSAIHQSKYPIWTCLIGLLLMRFVKRED